jgi:rhodanese-related sulfurtransferase
MRQTKILEKAYKNELRIIDVRTKEEYKEGFIPTAQLMPLDLILNNAYKDLPKDQLICLYCHSGRRSGIAKKILKKAGYKVKNIGGIISWKLEIHK